MENAAQPVTPPGQPAAQEAPARYATPPRNQLVPVGIGVLALFLAAAAYMVGGEPRNFITYGLAIAPVAILAALAYAGIKNVVAAVFTYIWLVMLGFGIILQAFASILPLYIKDMALLTRASKDPSLLRTV